VFQLLGLVQNCWESLYVAQGHLVKTHVKVSRGTIASVQPDEAGEMIDQDVDAEWAERHLMTGVCQETLPSWAPEGLAFSSSTLQCFLDIKNKITTSVLMKE
jgi:hypothetical protein